MAAKVPWFFVVSFMVIVEPTDARVGAESADTMKSGAATVIDLVHVLLFSFNSGKAFPPSATTIR